MGTDDRRAAGLSLRYGFFYGPGTWYHRDGALAREIREGRMPIVGDGLGRWSWVHVDDAVVATLAALEQGRGVLNVCDDEPAAMADWLPHAASVLGAEPPPRMPTSLVHKTAGPDLVHYGTRMPGRAMLARRQHLVGSQRGLAGAGASSKSSATRPRRRCQVAFRNLWATEKR
jgi:2-alkyl-3-oxoalkanoate reductase